MGSRFAVCCFLLLAISNHLADSFPKAAAWPFPIRHREQFGLQILRLSIPDFNQTEIENAPLAERRKRRMFLA